jgi:hypothetical protein
MVILHFAVMASAGAPVLLPFWPAGQSGAESVAVARKIPVEKCSRPKAVRNKFSSRRLQASRSGPNAAGPGLEVPEGQMSVRRRAAHGKARQWERRSWCQNIATVLRAPAQALSKPARDLSATTAGAAT